MSLHPHALDPQSLKVGDKVEVCLCDTSATCVWSYPATVACDQNGLHLISNQVNYEKVSLKSIDGCYAYLEKQWIRA